ncbi:MAG TPA: ferritin-like domain-containing protein [Rhodospirillales bacterium]|nr:ferritin-like domain-containing protein [Rhodospirillales bacterium]
MGYLESSLGSEKKRPPKRPLRPRLPVLMPARNMPRRRPNSIKGRLAFMHAITHIELNAIDLAWDIIARFRNSDLPLAFYDDWVNIANDEAKHFSMLTNYLNQNNACYGDFPAHDSLWESAEKTSDDILSRLAIVPLVLEARGLDTTPGAINKLSATGDTKAARILKIIGEEEISHVATGVRWFHHICKSRELEPASTFQLLVKSQFNGFLKPPFATYARTLAGFPRFYYEPLSKLR